MALESKLQGKPFDINVIQVYAPAAECSDADIDRFYDELDEAMGISKSYYITMVMGDFNAKVGGERNDDIVGGHGIGTKNERGDRQIKWAHMNKL